MSQTVHKITGGTGVDLSYGIKYGAHESCVYDCGIRWNLFKPLIHGCMIVILQAGPHEVLDISATCFQQRDRGQVSLPSSTIVLSAGIMVSMRSPARLNASLALESLSFNFIFSGLR